LTRTIDRYDLEAKKRQAQPAAQRTLAKSDYVQRATQADAPTPIVAAPVTTPPVPIQITETAAPTVNVYPEIKVQPEIIVQQPTVTVLAPDMQAIADAIAKLQPVVVPAPIVTVDAPNLTPITDSISSIVTAIQTRPDHGQAIATAITELANKPQINSWKFEIMRNAHGSIETVTANAA
jgi:hypothetical protein